MLSNGDVVFDASIINEVVHSPIDDLIVTDVGSYTEESMKITIDSDGYINDISKKITSDIALGNSIDVYKFSANSSNVLFKWITKIIVEDNNLKN